MAYNAELQMLREFYLLYAPREVCKFCGEPIIHRVKGTTFGHRRHTKIWELNFTVHHENENREDNTDGNLSGCHSTCHRKHHKSKGGDNNGKQEEGEEKRQEEVAAQGELKQ